MIDCKNVLRYETSTKQPISVTQPFACSSFRAARAKEPRIFSRSDTTAGVISL